MTGGGSVGKRQTFHFEIITTPTSDTPGTSLLLHFADRRYILGELTEGTQRACIQRGIGLKKVRGVFLAGKTHWNHGGLIGMILSMADVQQSEVDDKGKRPQLRIYAGPKQLHSLACARRFVFRTGMPLKVREFDARPGSYDRQPIHEDDNIRVWAITTQAESAVDAGATGNGTDIVPEEHLQKQHLRDGVVLNMFDSDWKRDQLFQSKLRDVKLPALVYVRDPETKTMAAHAIMDLDSSPLKPDTDVFHRNPWPASKVEKLPPTTDLPFDAVMSYIVKGYPQRGNFDAGKAQALGLKPGPNYAKLAAGQSVQSDDKVTTITPDMVLSPGHPGRGLAVFDVPSLGHLEDLRRQLHRKYTDQLEGVEVMIWMTRGEALQSHAFQELLSEFKNVKHVVSDASLCNDHLTNDSSALSTGRLAQLVPGLFSIPRFDNAKPYSTVISDSSDKVPDLLVDAKIIPAKRGLKFYIEPNVVMDETEVAPNLDHSSFVEGIQPAVQKLLPNSDSLRVAPASGFLSSSDLQEPEIITLGTGSASPSKYRNVSAVLLRMPKGIGNYLFDCGEGTLGQMKRMYSPEQLDDILFNLRAIWISHLHADHHLGTMSMLKTVYKTVQRLADAGKRTRLSPPYLISEINMIDYVDEYQSVLGLPVENLCTPVSCDAYSGLSHRDSPFDMEQNDPHIRKWETVKVSHCHGAQAVSVTFKNGFKFSYSGDCRPSDHFCRIGAGSDVLVHEATFDDGMEGDAKAKKHSTTGEAVGVALEMRAKNLILTHFSQRYQKIPIFSSVKMPERISEEDLFDDDDAEMANNNPTTNGREVGESLQKMLSTESSSSWTEPEAARELPIAVAFDLMRIRVSQIKEMKKYYPAITKMFEILEEQRDNARKEAVEQERKEKEGKKLAREAAMEKNSKKKAAANTEKQKEVTSQRKSKKDKRRADERAVNGVEQTRTTDPKVPDENENAHDHESEVLDPRSPTKRRKTE